MVTGVADVHIKKVKEQSVDAVDDVLAIEEPVEIKLSYSVNGNYTIKNISITMRTPGNDAELAIGFLFTEGIISSNSDVKSCISLDENQVLVTLNEGVDFDMSKLERNFYTTSSCGVCGKASIDAVKTVCRLGVESGSLQVNCTVIKSLPSKLGDNQSLFTQTGGIHASALFSAEGELLLTKEDVGRHNALDKLIGAALAKGMLPLGQYVLLLSGRASFELIQKAAMAGIKMVAAVGAPSSLAVQTAKEFDMTLIGFLRAERFNIYCGDNRIVI